MHACRNFYAKNQLFTYKRHGYFTAGSLFITAVVFTAVHAHTAIDFAAEFVTAGAAVSARQLAPEFIAVGHATIAAKHIAWCKAATKRTTTKQPLDTW